MDQKQHFLFYILAGLFGIAILTPQINFQPALSQGDHGLNFYVFQRVANGDVLYRDLWWGYGPLSPYYYAFFYQNFGQTMSAILLGRQLLIFISGLFVFLTLGRFVAPLLAMATSIWFWIYHPDFFYSYNHTGAFTLFLAMTYILFSYYKKPKKRYIIYGLITAFFVNLIRVNMGLVLLLGLVVTCYLTDRFIHKNDANKKIPLYLGGGLAVCAATFYIYWAMLHELPTYAIHQCMPYFSSIYHDTSSAIKYKMYFNFIGMLLNQSWRYMIFFGLLIFSFVQVFRILKNKDIQRDIKQPIIYSLSVMLFLILLVSHEFIMGFQLYRINWTIPYQMIFFALLIGFAIKKYSLNIRYAVTIFVLFVAVFDTVKYLNQMDRLKVMDNFIAVEKAQIFVGNRTPWIRTVEDTANYLSFVLKNGEQFYGMPYEPLYYFLSDTKSPSWHVLLMHATELTAEQETQMLERIKQDEIRYVLLSNRFRSKEPGMGELGVTHLKDFSAYVNNNFQTEITFGLWDEDPGWNYNHGVKLLRRIEQ